MGWGEGLYYFCCGIALIYALIMDSNIAAIEEGKYIERSMSIEEYLLIGAFPVAVVYFLGWVFRLCLT